jgi:hypothetical protein
VEDPETGGAGSVQWQRARLVLDQHQRGVDVGPVGRVLPVRAELAQLLPYQGLRRGSTVVVRGSTTVLLALLARATAEGSWAGVVGMPDLGLLAAAELGVAVSRLALVPRPGAEFGAVVAALLDGVDLVAVVAGGTVAGLARRLSARARHRESVLVSFGAWPGADLELDCAESSWSGLDGGHGHLVERELTVTVRGRGAAARPTRGRVTLPAGPGARPGTQRPRPVAIPAAGSAPARPAAAPYTPNRQPACGASHEPGSAWPTRLGALPGPRGTNPPPTPETHPTASAPNPAELDPAAHNAAALSPAALNPANHGPAGYSPAGFDPADRTPADRTPAEHGPADHSPAGFDPAELDSAEFDQPRPVLHIVGAG